MKVGIIGCGNISETYINSQKIFNNFKIISCSDIDINKGKKIANKYNIKFQTVEELLKNDEIELIINLTIPIAHKEIILKSLNAEKHCYSEKPLAIKFEDGLEIKKLSDDKNLLVGCAPDTFLGAAGQKAKMLIESNSIGKVVLGTFNIMSRGMEHWHPNPDFFFQPGAGPIFDLGVYYITQLINLLGPIKSIYADSSTAIKERTITSQPRYGEKIKVKTPTSLIGVLEFYNETKIQFFCSWDIWKHKHSNIELYGIDGSLILPDPNFFSGDILFSKNDKDWEKINNDKMLLGIPNKQDGEISLANYRGIGLSDMINSIENKILNRCSLGLSLHVLEVMEGILKSADNKKIFNTTTKCEKVNIFQDDEIKKLLN